MSVDIQINGKKYVPSPEPKPTKEWDERQARRMTNQINLQYAVEHYSNWEEIDDPRFHQLKAAYLRAWEDLQEHVTARLENHDLSF